MEYKVEYTEVLTDRIDMKEVTDKISEILQEGGNIIQIMERRKPHYGIFWKKPIK